MDPRDAGPSALMARMGSHSDFEQWWQAREVAVQSTENKVFHRPSAGTLTLDWDPLTSSTAPDQHIVVWTPVPGSPSEQRLHHLAVGVAARAAEKPRTAQP
ncbi:hypothetical protein [Streptomyces sp. NPDC059597]|uniref:MmyB family transcriptional regulator n=1 Tax=Streptomyces sp. NPDC059597 TaxID=3346879 RepID=UPI0036A959E2